jgi:hypothetical protein
MIRRSGLKPPHPSAARGLLPPAAPRLSQDLGFSGFEEPGAIELCRSVAKLRVLRLSNAESTGKATDEVESSTRHYSAPMYG